MTSDDVFNYALGVIKGSEGGLSMNPADRGNWTGGAPGLGELKGSKFGISAKSYPDLDIANLTYADAETIYKRDYWDEIGAANWAPAFAVVALDIAINHGKGRLSEWLQEGPQDAISLSERRLEHYISLSDWATFGKGWSRRVFRTLKAAQMLEVRVRAETETLLS